MEKIYALEKNYALELLTRIENATKEDRLAAEKDWYGRDIQPILEISGDKAFINITGSLSKEPLSPLHKYYGFTGTSYKEIVDAIAEASENEDVKTIVLNMDTPGGEVMGVDTVCDSIAKCNKKTIAINHGMIASAGYWIASACNKIYASEPQNLTGSVGVVIISVDFSKMYDEIGIKVIEVVSRNAPNKRPDPKTKTGKSILQEQADAIENVFMSRVAKGRRTTLETVRSDFARGGLLIAQNPDGPDAKQAGMIDGMMPSDLLATEQQSEQDEYYSGGSPENKTTPTGETRNEGEISEESMTLKEFLASNPEAAALHDKQVADARAEGVEAGRKEVQARIDATVNFIGNAEYKGIEPLAQKVLKGESEISSLEGAVAAFDMMKEQGKSAGAQADTVEAGEAGGEQQHTPSALETGEITSEEDFQAMIAAGKNGGIE